MKLTTALFALAGTALVANAAVVDFSGTPSGEFVSYYESGATFTAVGGGNLTSESYGNTPNDTRGLIACAPGARTAQPAPGRASAIGASPASRDSPGAGTANLTTLDGEPGVIPGLTRNRNCLAGAGPKPNVTDPAPARNRA